jgi:hypothetical protein
MRPTAHWAQPEAGLLKKSSWSAPALGVTKFNIARVMILVALKSDLDVPQTHVRFQLVFLCHTQPDRIS